MSSDGVHLIPTGALAAVPERHLSQYAQGFAMESLALALLLERVRATDMTEHAAQARSRAASRSTMFEEPTYRVEQGVAHIEARGPLSKYGSSFSAAPSSLELRRAMREAVADQAVGAIFVLIDSPGGTVSGTHELADDFRDVGRAKPTFAHIEDLGASAAYWFAAQAGTLTASPGSQVGSIGTYAVVADTSELHKREGVRVHVVAAGAFKGAGVPGTEVTEAHLTEVRRTIEALNENFLAGVAAGRRRPMSEVRNWADGRVHEAQAAAALGLIDRVSGIDAAIMAARAAAARWEQSSAPGRAASQPASTRAMAADRTLAEAQAEHAAARARAKAEWKMRHSPFASGGGVPAQAAQPAAIAILPAPAPPLPEPAAKVLERRVAEEISRHGINHAEATRRVFIADPALRERFVDETNNARARR